jgi:S-adenosylmethionine synthetase
VQTFGTAQVPEAAIEAAVREQFDLSPRGIIEALELRAPIYRATAAYGHFGRHPERRVVEGLEEGTTREVECFTWERTDRASELLETANRLARAAQGAGR